jgi:predicted outer membrane repeat protein
MQRQNGHGNTFTGNQAGGNGGGLECNQFNGSGSLSGNHFATNAAGENGGGL